MDYATSRPVSSFPATVRGVLLSPGEFFAGVRRDGSLKAPIIFAIVCAALAVLVSGGYDLAVAALRGRLDEFGFFGTTGPGGALLILGAFLLLSPLFALLGVYVGGAIQHVFVWAILRGENSGFGRTLRVVAYASAAVSLFSWLPVVGLLVGAYGVYLHAVGFRDLHGASFGRALAAALVPYLIGVGFIGLNVYATDLTLAEFLLASGGPLSAMQPVDR